ncbi:MAG: SusD/RagB family nutrient-binding outer membrane lipoprotein [Tannerella sp.]|jgi:hypothetical protein|nr:SusD/RagB family nutrient-binding outer membrane lipoprotein [Tannerella sp.]
MKNIKQYGISLCMAFALVSCSDYLDINVDPDSPTNFAPTVDARLTAIEHAVLHTHGTTAHFTALVEQHITPTQRGNDRYGGPAQWEFTGANPRTVGTYPYQIFFVAAGGNFKDLVDKAEEEGAYHYLAAVKFFRATGFMVMTDFFGEMPYTEALGAVSNPAYDDGETIFNGCLKELDEAIELFQKTQEPGATPLAKGDSWNGGDVNKWIRMCYGFKARWLNNLSKKSALYKPDDILAALDKAPKSNAESIIIRHEDKDANIVDPLWGDPTKTSFAYIWLVNWSRVYYITKWYADLLTDFDGKGITDPRAYRLIPLIQTGENKQWTLSDGVDMRTDVRIVPGEFVPAAYDAATGEWTGSPAGRNYVSLHTKGVVNSSFKDVADDGTVLNSGTYYARPDAPAHFMAYPELCFIKAEVLLRKGDKSGAFNAYKDGIASHFSLMNGVLADYGDNDNLSKTPMSQTDIDAYLNTAIGTADDLTMGKIMMQKYIVMGFSHQNWNDLRRFDYDPQVYRGWEVPYEYSSGSSSKASVPDGRMLRRFRHSIHEYNYNNDNLELSHPAATKDDIYSYPVWWDEAE